MRGAAACLMLADTVEKVDFSKCAKFSRGAGAFVRKLYGGTHEQSHFQPAVLVNSLQGIRVPTAVFNGSAAKFYRHPPFLVFQQYLPIADMSHVDPARPSDGGCRTAVLNLPLRPIRGYASRYHKLACSMSRGI